MNENRALGDPRVLQASDLGGQICRGCGHDLICEYQVGRIFIYNALHELAICGSNELPSRL